MNIFVVSQAICDSLPIAGLIFITPRSLKWWYLINLYFLGLLYDVGNGTFIHFGQLLSEWDRTNRGWFLLFFSFHPWGNDPIWYFLDGLVQPPTRRNLLKHFQKLQNLFLPGQHLLLGTCELDEEEMAEYVGSFNEMSLVARQASTLTCNLCSLWWRENVKKMSSGLWTAVGNGFGTYTLLLFIYIILFDNQGLPSYLGLPWRCVLPTALIHLPRFSFRLPLLLHRATKIWASASGTIQGWGVGRHLEGLDLLKFIPLRWLIGKQKSLRCHPNFASQESRFNASLFWGLGDRWRKITQVV